MKKKMIAWRYQKKTKSMSEEKLRLTIRDAKKLRAQDPKGINNDYYDHEINYCSMELQERKNQKRRWVDALQMKNKKLVKVETA